MLKDSNSYTYSGKKNSQIIKTPNRGAWVAQSVNHLPFDFSSGHGLRVVKSSPASGSMGGRESSLPLFLSPFPFVLPQLHVCICTLSLSLSLSNVSKVLSKMLCTHEQYSVFFTSSGKCFCYYST